MCDPCGHRFSLRYRPNEFSRTLFLRGPSFPLFLRGLLSWDRRQDDPYGEDEFERSGDEGRKSPGRKSGGGRWAVCESSKWNMSKRMAGLNTLKRLSKDNR